MFSRKVRGGVPYFAFDELDSVPGLVHAFTSRETDSAREDAETPAEVAASKPYLLKALGLPGPARSLDQIHSGRVLSSQEWLQSRVGDGMVLTSPDEFAVVRTADCLAVLLIDPNKRHLSLVHAGWRGTLERISLAAVARLTDYGSHPRDIVAALGPAIRVCCYEVGPEVRQSYSDSGHAVHRLFEGRHLDLVEATRLQLIESGVTRILDSGCCTSCRTDLFYSWRRRQDRGRMFAIAGFRQSESVGAAANPL